MRNEQDENMKDKIKGRGNEERTYKGQRTSNGIKSDNEPKREEGKEG